ncbi:MAG: alanine racemase [Bacillota bacterium]
MRPATRKNDLDTPAVVIDRQVLDTNIAEMSRFAISHHLKLRPHVKAHKSPDIARRQIDAGAVGITVAKVGEAEVMAAAGVRDIFVANELVTPTKIDRLLALSSRVRLAVAVDNQANLPLLDRAAHAVGAKVGVLIEVDSGLHRCGVPDAAATLELARRIAAFPSLELRGIFTHAGQVYGAAPSQVAEIGRHEGEIMVSIAETLKAEGLSVNEVSVGSTPTARTAGAVAGVTEIRPGNYVFHDAIQIGLGVVPEERCSLRVMATVISRPAEDRLVLDAGSKTLGLDRGAHGTSVVQGFGRIIGWPGLRLERLSEEHGVAILTPEAAGAPLPRLGQAVEIIPNHACVVANLARTLAVVEGDRVVDLWPVAASGRSD